MLERAGRLEECLKEYPTSKAVGKVEELYKKYVKEVVTGGYSEWDISKNGYLAEDGSHINNTVLEEYSLFIDQQGDTSTAKILIKYREKLNQSKKEMTKVILEFYDKLDQLIETTIP